MKVYEDRVGKIYEKHRCRVEGGKKKEVAVESLEKVRDEGGQSSLFVVSFVVT